MVRQALSCLPPEFCGFATTRTRLSPPADTEAPAYIKFRCSSPGRQYRHWRGSTQPTSDTSGIAHAYLPATKRTPAKPTQVISLFWIFFSYTKNYNVNTVCLRRLNLLNLPNPLNLLNPHKPTSIIRFQHQITNRPCDRHIQPQWEYPAGHFSVAGILAGKSAVKGK